jgi:hypothetical protein
MSYARPETGAFKEFTTHAIQKISSPGDGLKVAIGEAFDSDAQARIENAARTIFAALPVFSEQNTVPKPHALTTRHIGKPVTNWLSKDGTFKWFLAVAGITLLAGFFFGKKPSTETVPPPPPPPEIHTLYSVTRTDPQPQEFRLNQKLEDQLIAFRIATDEEIDKCKRGGGVLERESLNRWLARFKLSGPVVDSVPAAKLREIITSDLIESVDKLGRILLSGESRSGLVESRRIEQKLREDLLFPDQEIASLKDEKGVVDPSKAHLKIISFASGQWPTAAVLELLESK